MEPSTKTDPAENSAVSRAGPGQHDVLLAIVGGLVRTPILLLVFAVSFLILGGGAAALIAAAANVTNAPTLITSIGLFMVLPVISLVLVVAYQLRPATRSTVSANDRVRERLMDALRAFQTLLFTPFQKNQLAFHLRVTRLPHQPRTQAMVDLHGSYEITSIVNDDQIVPFVAQIEVSASERRSEIPAELIITDLITGSVKTRNIFLRCDAPDRSTERVFSDTIPLPANARYRVEWRTGRYCVDLPHTEFWATAHAVFGMSVTVRYDPPGFKVRGDCYRRVSEEPDLRPQVEDGTYSLTVDGLILPYQGIFLQIIDVSDDDAHRAETAAQPAAAAGPSNDIACFQG